MLDSWEPKARLGLLVAVSAVLAAAAISLLASGEDPPTESERISVIVRDFVTAGNERDFTVVCNLLSEKARDEVERFASALALSGDDACAKALQARAAETIGDQSVEVLEVRIVADRAAVDVATEDPEEGRAERTLELVRDDAGEWKVSSFGG